VKYFAANRFWELKWREFGFFLLLALALTGFSFWQIRRELSWSGERRSGSGVRRQEAREPAQRRDAAEG
jgi:hypothetical protein